MDAAPEPPDPKRDGRKLRSADSRKRIVAAMLELVQSGNSMPAAEDVALRAGVGLRTVFRQFRDMEGLSHEMVEATRAEYVQAFSAKLTGETWRDRVHEMTDRLIRIFEYRLPMRRASNARRYQSPALARGLADLNDATRNFLKQQFPAPLFRDALRLEHAMLILSYEAWMRLRDDQGLNARQAARLVHAALDHIMAVDAP